MKCFVFLLALGGLFACSSSHTAILIPARQRVELQYPDADMMEVTLRNTGKSTLRVGVVNDTTQLRGFGLNKSTKATILLEADNQLVLYNESESPIPVKLSMAARNPSTFKNEGDYVNFTLRNNSAQSIPLIIPSVMNPNLSPFSNSGVGLKIGQEILFKEDGKRYVLLTVDNTIQDGTVIEVAQLLKDRRRELGL